MKQYSVIFKAGNGMTGNQFLHLEFDLIEGYKRAILQKDTFISWEKGVLRVESVLGIIDNSPPEPPRDRKG